MTTPFDEPSASDPQAAQPNQSLGQQARDAWHASGQTGVVNAAKFGYSFGRNAAQQQGQPAPSDGGWGSQGGVRNGNGGDDELATKGDVNEAASGLHDRLGNIESGMQQNAGGVQDRNNAFAQGHQGGGQVQNQPPDMLAQFAAHRDNAYAQMEASSQHLQATRDRSTSQFQQRQSSFRPVGTSSSGIGMSAGQSEATMSGLLPVQNAISDSQYQNQRFRGQQ